MDPNDGNGAGQGSKVAKDWLNEQEFVYAMVQKGISPQKASDAWTKALALPDTSIRTSEDGTVSLLWPRVSCYESTIVIFNLDP